MLLILTLLIICSGCSYGQYGGTQYGTFRNDYYYAPRTASAWDLWNEKLRELDTKLSAQLVQRTVALRRRIDELQNEISEMRKAETYDWNRSDSDALYKLFENKKNFDDAQAVCKSFHSQLAIIDNKGKNDYIKELVAKMLPDKEKSDSKNGDNDKRLVWIGLRTEKVEMSSDEGSYSNFADNQPVDGCAAMASNGKWEIRNCTEARPFVCQQIEQAPVQQHDDKGLRFAVKCCQNAVGLFHDLYRK